MAEIMQHLTALADEIGPRPATSDAESRAADYIKSVFVARGLEPEVQEFDAPRTYSWAYVIYFVLTITSAVVAGIKPEIKILNWGALIVAAAVAVFFWLDLDTRRAGLTHLMPKGPSQNVIARHVPKARRGEKLKKIVIVAHYDTARASLAFSPGMVRQFPVTFALTKWATFLTPVFILAMATPWVAKAEPYLWYVTMVVAAYLLIPMIINIQRELMMPFVDGANDNASGVAAMLGVLHNLVSEPEASRFSTSQFEPVQRGAEAALEADVVPDGALLSYSPAGSREAGSELPDDFRWAESSSDSTRQPERGQGLLDFDTIDFAAVGPDAVKPSRAEEPRPESRRTEAPVAAEAPSRPYVPSGPDTLPGAGALPGGAVAEDSPPKRRGFLGGLGLGKKKKAEEDHDVKGWLGVDDEFDARKAGADIGSWDKFGSDDDDDDAGGLGWKGGWAGDDPIGDDDFSANEAARIRRRVTESVDRELNEKEVWFVATGAAEVGTFGMQALLDDYGDEIRDALIINLDNVGAGQLSWVTAEGMTRRYRAAQRVIGLAKRASRECEILVKPRVYKGLSTDATPALARGFKAMTLMAFDSSSLPMNWHWKTDVSANIEPEVIERTADLVTEMIREA
ncbi:MAG: M28 family peptidase [Coriobacteriia bacterium]